MPDSVCDHPQLDLPYRFVGDVPERDDLHLQIALVLTTGDDQVVTVQVYNAAVSVIDLGNSIFDPQVYVFPPRGLIN